MKILSFDVGIKNLAYCIFDSNTSKIIYWDIIDLNVQGFTGKIPSGLHKSIASAANDIHITLIRELDKLPFMLEVDFIVIEKQPSFNPKMRIIGGCLQSYFYIRGIIDKTEHKITSIEFFSPKHKLKCYTGPELKLVSKVKSKYAQTKKLGVMIAEIKLNELSENIQFKELFQKSKKKDDLADCYLQAITFCIFKKFIKYTINQVQPIEQQVQQQVQPIEQQKILTKLQIKNELKKHFQTNSGNKIELFENMDPHFICSIKNKYKIEIFTLENITMILTNLSLKSYLRR